jgi:hypothetical protein
MGKYLPVGYDTSDFIEGDSIQRHRLVANALQHELRRQCCRFLIQRRVRALRAALALCGRQAHCFYAASGTAAKLRRAPPEVEVELPG